MVHVDSHFVRFLRQYGPIPRNSNMYDEEIQRVLKRQRVTPISFASEYLDELVKSLNSATPKSIILTGTAGDGKTYLCREIWNALGGSSDAWDLGSIVQKLQVGGRQLTVIKDLSELGADEKSTQLSAMAKAIVGPNADGAPLFLVAANDGQLVEAWKQLPDSAEVITARKLIEDLLVEDKRELRDHPVLMYNLSRVDSATLFVRVLEAVLEHPGWDDCNNCAFSTAEGSNRCPIFENKSRLVGESYGGDTTRKRLVDLLQLCELNDIHISVRQLLLLIANALLGHPRARDHLMTCKDVPNVVEEGTTSDGSLYRNLLGENLSERRRSAIAVFDTIGRFGIGNETNNRTDNLLIFGNDDPNLTSLYSELVKDDLYYGADTRFRASQSQYLEGNPESRGEDFLKLLRAQRQRLFFVLPYQHQKTMRLWDLTVYQHGGEYLEEVYRALVERMEKIPKNVLARLVRGLNRIFTGLLLNNCDELIIATSGSHSQAKVSKVLEEIISVPKNRGESVTIEKDSSGQLFLVVSLAAHSDVTPVRLELSLMRYEFLCRVADGALPDSFSRECYEDILAFKTKLLKQLEKRRAVEGYGPEEAGVRVRILDMDAEGSLRPKTLEVR